MATEAVEYSYITVTVVNGTNVDGATIGTTGGAFIGAEIVKTETIGNSTTYTVFIVHDATGTTALEYSVRSVTIANNAADSLDNVYRTNEGAAVAVAITKTATRANSTTYDIFTVHAVS